MSTYQEIAELAYRLWDAHGRPEGTQDQDWLAAERQLAISNTPREDERSNNSTSPVSQEASRSPADNSLEPGT
jgi:Protein of unknown function (DUF2934)